MDIMEAMDVERVRDWANPFAPAEEYAAELRHVQAECLECGRAAVVHPHTGCDLSDLAVVRTALAELH